MGDGSPVSVVDLAKRPRIWRPAIDDLNPRGEVQLYHDLADLAELRVSRDPSGNPLVAVSEGDGSVALYRVPSVDLFRFLDRFALSRHRHLPTPKTLENFVRLLQARVSSRSFEPDPPFVGERAPWNEARALPSEAESAVERLADVLDNLSRSGGWVARPDDIAIALSTSPAHAEELVVDNDVQLRARGLRVRTMPSAFGTCFVVVREEPSVESSEPRAGRTTTDSETSTTERMKPCREGETRRMRRPER